MTALRILKHILLIGWVLSLSYLLYVREYAVVIVSVVTFFVMYRLTLLILRR